MCLFICVKFVLFEAGSYVTLGLPQTGHIANASFELLILLPLYLQSAGITAVHHYALIFKF